MYDAKLLVMDEPTSALSSGEVDALFKIVRTLRDKGMAIIFISHKLDEHSRIADRMTVLRDGKLIGTAPAAEMDRRRLISMMVGREISEERLVGKGAGEVVLEVRDISKAGNYQNVSFSCIGARCWGSPAWSARAARKPCFRCSGSTRPTAAGLLEGRKITPRSPAEAKSWASPLCPNPARRRAWSSGRMPRAT